jgi:hypothetical protein
MDYFKKRHLAFAGFVVVLAFAGCGGGGGASDEAQIEATIKQVMTAVTPSACAHYSTQDFLEQRTGEKGDAAVEKCESDAESSELRKAAEKIDLSKEISFSNIEVDGDEATAEMSFKALDRKPIEFELVREDDLWKVDGVKVPDAGSEPHSKVKIVENLLHSCGGEASEAEIEGLIGKLDGLPAKQGADLLIREVKEICSA